MVWLLSGVRRSTCRGEAGGEGGGTAAAAAAARLHALPAAGTPQQPQAPASPAPIDLKGVGPVHGQALAALGKSVGQGAGHGKKAREHALLLLILVAIDVHLQGSRGQQC